MNLPAHDDGIWHIALREDWEAALAAGVYAVSTRGLTVAEVGFLHASFDADQVGRVATAWYGDGSPLMVLELSLPALHAAGLEVRVEPGDPRDPDSERFPHVYGPVPTSAVRRALPAVVRDGLLSLLPPRE